MGITIELVVAAAFLIVGLSHLLHPRGWTEFFIQLRERGAVGSLQLGLLQLPFALLIVGFHNVWRGLAILVTLIGWAQLLKALVYLLWPNQGLRMLNAITPERWWRFRVAGLFAVLLSGGIFVASCPSGRL
jgi:hypothetical protein